ncbi:hypothetical protein G4B88_008617 [Cannabis sativa]|uniref:Uncharacterized protein n=1 Tax=Cannabis sativa TaxID=3483 RepID=A0A7J6FC85_CANSA|nr:hypothetical protein G4B88_008617 [Cannabis sativa]
MVQQTVDSKVREYGMGTTETEFPTSDKQLPVAVKKTVLRDLQNDSRVRVPNSIEKSPLLKDTSPLTSTIKLSGTKRDSLECPESPSQHRSSNSNFTNGHLVYVRRKSEAELGKSSTCDSTNTNTNTNRLQSRPFGQQKEIIQPLPQTKNPGVSCLPGHSPIAMTSSMISSRKPSVPLPQKSGMQLASKESTDPLFLIHLYQQVDYIKMLWSLSSVELNRHAVELEKRSIQLSLEEAKELQRVQVLNVLGKPSVSSSTHQNQPEKGV